MALANERAGYVSSPLPSVAGQVEVAPGGAGGRARACGGESGRVTVVTDHLSVRGEAGREGRAARLGSVPGPADGEALRGAGRFPPGGGESRALFGGGGGGGGVQELCRSPCLLAVVPSPVPRPASLGSLDFPPSPPCSPSSPLTSTPPSVTPPITGLHQGPQQN